MNKEQVICWVFAFILGILVSDMYQNMCGCNSIVEGAEPPPASGGGGGEGPVEAAVETAETAVETAETAAEPVDTGETIETSDLPSTTSKQYPLKCSGDTFTLDTSNPITNLDNPIT